MSSAARWRRFQAMPGGAGKSSLTRLLSEYFGWEPFYEQVDDNPYLSDFYEDMRRWSFNLQVYFLSSRFNHQRNIEAAQVSVVQDRSIYEDAEIFARGLYEQGTMTPLEHDLYVRLYGELLHSPAARPPKLLIYLHGPLDVIVGRIVSRGRPAERDTEMAYWATLHSRYERWIAGFRHCPVLSLDIREYDLLSSPAAIEAVAGGASLLQPVSTDPIRSRYRYHADDAPKERFSEREVAILRLLAGGYSNKEIARAMFLAEGTVKNYVSVILDKLDTRDRTRAVLKAITLRVI